MMNYIRIGWKTISNVPSISNEDAEVVVEADTEQEARDIIENKLNGKVIKVFGTTNIA